MLYEKITGTCSDAGPVISKLYVKEEKAAYGEAKSPIAQLTQEADAETLGDSVALALPKPEHPPTGQELLELGTVTDTLPGRAYE